MSRKCRNQYRNCQNPAVKDTGNSIYQRLCAECLQRRRQKQAMTAAQPNCKCGNKMGLNATQCRGCDYKDEQREREAQDMAERIIDMWRAEQ